MAETVVVPIFRVGSDMFVERFVSMNMSPVVCADFIYVVVDLAVHDVSHRSRRWARRQAQHGLEFANPFLKVSYYKRCLHTLTDQAWPLLPYDCRTTRRLVLGCQAQCEIYTGEIFLFLSPLLQPAVFNVPNLE